jgi:hypothetical protein
MQTANIVIVVLSCAAVFGIGAIVWDFMHR